MLGESTLKLNPYKTATVFQLRLGGIAYIIYLQAQTGEFMGKLDKLLKKLENHNATWVWNELTSLLKHLGYEQIEGSGSRIKFDNGNSLDMINLHKPHPGNEVKAYVIRQVREKLKNRGLL